MEAMAAQLAQLQADVVDMKERVPLAQAAQAPPAAAEAPAQQAAAPAPAPAPAPPARRPHVKTEDYVVREMPDGLKVALKHLTYAEQTCLYHAGLGLMPTPASHMTPNRMRPDHLGRTRDLDSVPHIAGTPCTLRWSAYVAFYNKCRARLHLPKVPM